jgi:hypothetical protein
MAYVVMWNIALNMEVCLRLLFTCIVLCGQTSRERPGKTSCQMSSNKIHKGKILVFHSDAGNVPCTLGHYAASTRK